MSVSKFEGKRKFERHGLDDKIILEADITEILVEGVMGMIAVS
jgi:hypothetical protein